MILLEIAIHLVQKGSEFFGWNLHNNDGTWEEYELERIKNGVYDSLFIDLGTLNFQLEVIVPVEFRLIEYIYLGVKSYIMRTM